MKDQKIIVLLLILFAFSVALTSPHAFAFKDKKEQKEYDELSDTAKRMGESLAAQTKIQPVDYKVLKKLLPKKFRGFSQVDVQGGRNSMFGIRLTHAEAEYEGRKDAGITIKITDFGSVKGLVGRAMLAWMSAEIDNESDHGYERTIEYKGYKGFEKYDYEDKEGKLSLIVARRFLVDVEGENVSMKQIKKAMSGVNLKKLFKLRNYGLPEEI